MLGCFCLLPAILGAAFDVLSRSEDCSSADATQILLVLLAAAQGLLVQILWLYA